ncbi:DNA adenine methylase [Sulfurimonas sp.]|nr:DNA adenine methylase [Sulfurimonas sp.]
MNYIGSKFRLSSWIKDEVIRVVGEELSEKVFCDIFAGTGQVGRAFKKDVKKVIANDFEHYSYVLNKNYIFNHEYIEDKDKYLEELNNLPLIDSGFIYNNYCKGSGSQRQYFSDENGKRIDTVRAKIDEWRDTKRIDENLYYFLLASLLESADKVANTASIYEAFLKSFKPQALKSFKLLPAEFIVNKNSHEVFNENSNDLIKKISGDILYLDPPYNHRHYGSQYHILNTIALNDEFTPKGKTGLREYQRSDYSIKSKVHNSFEELISDAKFKYIFLSYNNEGLMSEQDVKSIMQRYGEYSLVKKEYKRFKVQMNKSTNKTFEYLHILEKKS